MDRAELEAAIEEVSDHYSGGRPTVNKVLAAHLRALGVTPNGDAWARAKAAVDGGVAFADAAAAAASGAAVHQEQAGTRQPVRDRKPARVAKPASRAEQPTAEDGEPVIERDARRRDRPVGAGRAAVVGALEWFPKRFGQGDMDGEGGKRLLGQPSIPRVAVLVREAAQNSWDARLPDAELVFGLDLRDLGERERRVLEKDVLTGYPENLPLEAAMEPGARALEIYDRGASGLGGPTREDLTVPEGQSTDFIDFVFVLGAPRDKHLGGGTYGFGKTASYVASRCSTVVIWTRTRTADGLEYRLIASAIGQSFDLGRNRFTGRHWWGRVSGDGTRVDPLVGPEAKRIGEQLFGRHFDGEETGTSLLVLDPELGGASSDDDVQRLRESILWHLWPKLVVQEGETPPMTIELRRDGKPQPLPDVENHPVLQGHVRCLRAVRAVQAGEEPDHGEWPFPVQVKEIRCYSPDELLGHLALTRYPSSGSGGCCKVRVVGRSRPL